MGRSDLERLSREELIELVLRLQRQAKTSRTSSKSPATDLKGRREQAKPGGAKPGHEGHSRAIGDDPDAVVEHRPDRCACCGGALHGDLPAELVSLSARIDLPALAPIVTQHRRLAVHCPGCGARVVAPVPVLCQLLRLHPQDLGRLNPSNTGKSDYEDAASRRICTEFCPYLGDRVG